MKVKRGKNRPKVTAQKSVELRGWPAIAGFLGMPNSTAHRWGKEGMPVRRDGRNVIASPNELNQWLQRTSGESAGVHVAIAGADLLKDMRASLAAQGKNARPRSTDGHNRSTQVKIPKKNTSRKPTR